MIPQILGKSAEIPAGDGSLLLASALQGRIFAVMDGELTKVSMELTNSMTDLSLSDTELLIAQLEADFAAYAEN